MKALNLQNILEQICGRLIKGDKNIIIEKAVRNFRDIGNNTLYLDLYRDKSFDMKILEKYQAVAIVTDEPKKFNGIEGSFTLIYVKNIKEAYWKFVDYYRSLFPIPIVAVTGTCGKTTTCEMIKHILLSKKYNITSTETAFKLRETRNSYVLNFKYLTNIDEKTQVAVFEAAVGGPGQLSDGCRHFKPQIRILLNIGVYHLVGCKTPEGYINAKAEILEGMDPIKDLLILSADDENIKKIDVSKVGRIMYLGIDNKADFQAKDINCSIDGTNFTISFRDKLYKAHLNTLGRHDVYNALAAIAAVNFIGVDIEEACEILKTYKTVYKHLELRTGKGDCQILDDDWNNNPTSMVAALNVFQEIAKGQRKIAVFGRMPNIGTSEYAQEQYAEMGKKVVEAGVNILIIVGDEPIEIGLTAAKFGMDENNIFYAKDRNEVYKYLNPYMEKGTMILLKSCKERIVL